ncbi:unnamed protein product [Darwinula stevensoni]|uniref:Uncharacterized protein n=1 Tax=Darwinula stevensoni TaxID=69355 RepID=A0A7R9A3X7_9CRUS|nr:unnamed protein product [Darwinula stevensoni]CAG0891465.1 unnamed protein product [Darwinula stevensoni]
MSQRNSRGGRSRPSGRGVWHNRQYYNGNPSWDYGYNAQVYFDPHQYSQYHEPAWGPYHCDENSPQRWQNYYGGYPNDRHYNNGYEAHGPNPRGNGRFRGRQARQQDEPRRNRQPLRNSQQQEDSAGARGDQADNHRGGEAVATNSTVHVRPSYKYSGGPRRGGSRRTREEVSQVSQRENLVQQLTNGTYECMVCCDQVRQKDPVWSCTKCYHVFHLLCAKKWAKSSHSGDQGWRCPACQECYRQMPNIYRCFCSKMREPEWNRRDIPHSCGEVCGQERPNPLCNHSCTILCHPGPCPSCNAQVRRSCPCGKVTKDIRCGIGQFLCEEKCGKILNCGVHKCQKQCHLGPCEDCQETVSQVCYCGKDSQSLPCNSETAGSLHYECEGKCMKTLSCGNHECSSKCHEGDCPPCALIPSVVQTCPCGETNLAQLERQLNQTPRQSCMDPIPTCDKLCKRILSCGPADQRHTCQATCHMGHCPPCSGVTPVRCRCGYLEKEVPCKELHSKSDEILCEKRCLKRLSCSRHKCQRNCCIDVDHACPQICGKKLSCGLHKCEETCHRGNCPPCWRSSFDELYCHCASQVMFPPVPCGTRPPVCDQPCRRPHSCDHSVMHNCHSDPSCPPCTHLTEKRCHCGKEVRKHIPCFQDSVSCGRPCGKQLDCPLQHTCKKPCHSGKCLEEEESCTQPCIAPRPICSHPCRTPCHDGDCPESTPCKEMLKLSCLCGNRTAVRPCSQQTKEYSQVTTALLASQVAAAQSGETLDVSNLFKGGIPMKIECNEECARLDRNRRLALALQIQNPDLESKLRSPQYSQFMKDMGLKQPQFAQMVHEKLAELVQLAKQSKQKSRSYTFPPSGREKRQFIHEYCEHFGCESVAIDEEPNRSIIVTAPRATCWMPSHSLVVVVQREHGKRVISAPPIMSERKNAEITLKEAKSVTNEGSSQATSSASRPDDSSADAPIDYFDYPGPS